MATVGRAVAAPPRGDGGIQQEPSCQHSCACRPRMAHAPLTAALLCQGPAPAGLCLLRSSQQLCCTPDQHSRDPRRRRSEQGAGSGPAPSPRPTKASSMMELCCLAPRCFMTAGLPWTAGLCSRTGLETWPLAYPGKAPTAYAPAPALAASSGTLNHSCPRLSCREPCGCLSGASSTLAAWGCNPWGPSHMLQAARQRTAGLCYRAGAQGPALPLARSGHDSLGTERHTPALGKALCTG